MSSEIINYIDSFIDEKRAFFRQQALDIFIVLVEDNVSYSDKDLNIKQEKYKDKIIEYLNFIKYDKRDVIILINGLDHIYNECLKRSNLLIDKLKSLYSEQKITNDDKNNVKLKMLDAIKYEMEKHIGILLEGERKMLQNALIKTPQLSQLSQLSQPQPQQSLQQPLIPRQWPPPREELPPTPHTQQSSQPSQPSQSSQSQEEPPSNPQQRRPSQSPLLLQKPREKQGQQQQQQQQQQKQQKQQQRQQPAPRLLQRPPVQQHQLHQQQLQQRQMQQTRQLQQKQKGEDMANILRTNFYKTKYNKTKDGSGEVMKFNIRIVPRIKYTEDNDVIIDMIKGDSQINIETTNKYVYNFKEKKIINDIQDINIFLNGSNLKSIKYFLKPRKSGSPYSEITINIPFIILSDDDTHVYLTNTDISSSGTDIDLGHYIILLIDIINNYVRKQDPISFL
jgi:hypothetical protein